MNDEIRKYASYRKDLLNAILVADESASELERLNTDTGLCAELHKAIDALQQAFEVFGQLILDEVDNLV